MVDFVFVRTIYIINFNNCSSMVKSSEIHNKRYNIKIWLKDYKFSNKTNGQTVLP